MVDREVSGMKALLGKGTTVEPPKRLLKEDPEVVRQTGMERE